MKKSPTYVSRGIMTPQRIRKINPHSVFGDNGSIPAIGEEHSFLPRDYGMKGALGAYEVPCIRSSVSKILAEEVLALKQPSDDQLIDHILTNILGPECRFAIIHFTFREPVLTLVIPRAQQFSFSRFWIPKLKLALSQHYKHLVVRLEGSSR